MTIERFGDSTLPSGSYRVTGSITRELNGIVAGAVELWEGGAEPDARKLLEAFPQFRDHPSLALELVYEEYCCHREAGEAIDVSAFCERFSWLKSSLRRMIEVHDVFETHATTPREIPWPSEGEEICGFRIVAPIGTGSFSRVYVAIQTELGDRLVTIKVAEMVFDEARLMGRLSHEAIVPVLSVHHDLPAGLSVICMPYRGAATLEDVLNTIGAQTSVPTAGDFVSQVIARRNQSLPAIETRSPLARGSSSYCQSIVQIALPIVDALESAHRKGVIHRDIKPSNVLLAPQCQPQLLDFNLSADLHDTTSRVGGTISYMPPEQLEVLVGLRKASELTPAVDVYSLGVVLYELLTGRLPYVYREVRKLREALETRRAAGLAGVPSPRSIRGEVPEALDALVLRCLHESAAARPTPAQLRESLQQIVQAPLERQQRQRRAMLVGGVALACGGVGGLLFRASNHAAPQRPSGPPSIEQLVKQANQDLQADRVADALAGFQAAYRQQRSPWLALGIAECLTRQRKYREAVSYWELANATFAQLPEAQCNYAHCLVHLREFSRSIAVLDDVVQRLPSMQAAWLNRVQLFVEVPDALFSASDAIASIERAIELGPSSAQQYLYAAQIYARSVKDQPNSRDKGLHSLREAILLGGDPSSLAQDRWIKKLAPSSSDLAPLVRVPNNGKRLSADLLARVLVPIPLP